MNRELIHQLSRLKLEESSIKRQLEYEFKHNEKREKLFFRLRDIKEEMKKIKFMLRLESVKRKNDNKY